MSEQNDETADGCEMLTATSDPVVLYQALCWAADEIEQLKRERDEAREQNAKLREIAESAVWRMENGVCLPDASAVRAIKEEGLRLRAELDQLKEGTK
jgi:hypothetical protein